MRKPIVLITATSRQETPGDPERVRLNSAYLAAVRRAGGLPLVTPPTVPGDAEDLLRVADALLLTGGEDVEPARYGAAPHPALGRVTPDRDDWEIALVHAAKARGLPTLGICRGIQVLNVALGGTLVQDVPSEHGDAIAHEQPGSRAARTHAVSITAGSRMSAIVGREAVVNSMHHQAIREPAPGLTVTGRAPDGIIESVEWTGDDWWALAVQWHPEELDGADRQLFGALVQAAERPAR